MWQQFVSLFVKPILLLLCHPRINYGRSLKYIYMLFLCLVGKSHLLKLSVFNIHFSEFVFYIFFTSGISKQLWAFIPIWSFFLLSRFCILSICLSDILHTAFPQAPVLPFFVKDFCFKKLFTSLGKRAKTQQTLFFFFFFLLDITQWRRWAVCDAENLTVWKCM